MDVNVKRTVPIEFKWVVDAYGKVRQGGKASGIDGESWEAFEANVQDNLYVIWNRLSSGSYHPQAVRKVEIPKKDGSLRKLGIPTLRDRIAQQVVKTYMENRIDVIFHKDSYGYRPMKSAHQAVKTIMSNCYKYDWVIDLDISNFFDEIDHELMLRAVGHVLEERWVSLYVKRWLEMPVQAKAGEVHAKGGKGTPQGGVISPLLSNLYLHFTLDKWLEKAYPEVRFVRYADDVVIHCRSKEEASEVLRAIKERLGVVRLSIKESKTKITYCRDYRRKQAETAVSFDFLGFSFRPERMQSKHGGYFTGFGMDMSSSSQKQVNESIRTERSLSNSTLEAGAIADRLNAKLRGWINYYGIAGNRGGLYRVMMGLNNRLIKWVKKKYKLSLRKAILKLGTIRQGNPTLFYHWQKGF